MRTSLVFILLWWWSNTSATRCPADSSNVHQLPSGQCIYMTKIDRSAFRRVQMDLAENLCHLFNEREYEWNLPSPSTKTEHEALTDVIRTNSDVFARYDNDNVYFWIGLKRDVDPSRTGEVLDPWVNPDRWRWTVDNSTLNSTFGAVDRIPWGENEPNNHGGNNQRCVYAHRSENITVAWYDHGCEAAGWPPIDLLVCESRSLVARSTTTTMAAAPIASAEPVVAGGAGSKTLSRRIGLGLGLSLTILVLAGVGLAVWYYGRRRTGSLGTRVDSTTADGTSSGSQRYAKFVNHDDQERVLDGAEIFAGTDPS